MAQVKSKKRVSGERAGNLLIEVILLLMVVTTLYPFWHVFMYSISDSRAAMSGGLFFLPRKPTFLTYQLIFKTSQIFVAFGNTVAKTVVGTFISLVLTVLTAYPLSLPYFRGRRFFQIVIFFTMLFSGGIIPTYLLLKDLHMLDTFWVYVLPSAMSPYNMFIMRNFFLTIPDSLQESAMLDGANHMQVLSRIVLPLSKASLATMTMFYGVTNWNSYMDGILYVNNQKLQLLQVYLRQLISSTGAKGALSAAGDLSAAAAVTEESMKMTVISLSIIPILLVYLFLQKYFTKGVMVGSVKG
ncbi:MAG: carbohydrate ABC transporter permease [Lacrimispora sp.]|uniref:carbohydrate ABC transporter permease n=1 Tax=Lacrimispora indolis TaxID=69825 RepID=UPI00045E594D|nr:carbohydrate ABC transporter permease [Lacrimispora indolis]